MCGNRGKMKSTNFSNNERLEQLSEDCLSLHELLSSSWEKLYVQPSIVPKHIIDDWIFNIRKIKEDIYKEIWAWGEKSERHFEHF
jgi:hypothetical protein